MFDVGGPELLVVLVVVLLLFGGKRIPEVARSLGSSISEFRRGLDGGADSKDNDGPSA